MEQRVWRLSEISVVLWSHYISEVGCARHQIMDLAQWLNLSRPLKRRDEKNVADVAGVIQ